MRELTITGCWRSYHIFHPRGGVQRNTVFSYKEIIVGEDSELIIKPECGCPEPLVTKTLNWKILQDQKRRFLLINGRRVYEIITCEINDLVLLDLSSDEKTFYSPINEWRRRIDAQSNETIIDQHPITLWSSSLIACVKQ